VREDIIPHLFKYLVSKLQSNGKFNEDVVIGDKWDS